MSFDRKRAVSECIDLGYKWRSYMRLFFEERDHSQFAKYYLDTMLEFWNDVVTLNVENKRIEWNIIYSFFLNYNASFLKIRFFKNSKFAKSLKPYFDNNNLTKEILKNKIEEHLTHALQ